MSALFIEPYTPPSLRCPKTSHLQGVEQSLHFLSHALLSPATNLRCSGCLPCVQCTATNHSKTYVCCRHTALTPPTTTTFSTLPQNLTLAYDPPANFRLVAAPPCAPAHQAQSPTCAATAASPAPNAQPECTCIACRASRSPSVFQTAISPNTHMQEVEQSLHFLRHPLLEPSHQPVLQQLPPSAQMHGPHARPKSTTHMHGTTARPTCTAQMHMC
jgi:hypothetical protein